MMRLLLGGFVVLLVTAAAYNAFAQPPSSRSWTDKTGQFRVEAVLVERTAKSVKLRKADGKLIDVPLDRLSQADLDFLAKSGEPSPEDVPASDAVLEAVKPTLESMVIVEVTDKSRTRCGVGYVVRNEDNGASVLLYRASIDYPGERPQPRPFLHREAKYSVLIDSPGKAPQHFDAQPCSRLGSDRFVLRTQKKLPRRTLELKPTADLADQQNAVVVGYLFDHTAAQPTWKTLIKPVEISVPPGDAGAFVLFEQPEIFGHFKPHLLVNERGELIGTLPGNSEVRDRQASQGSRSPEFQLNRPGRYSTYVSKITEREANLEPYIEHRVGRIGKLPDGKLLLEASFSVFDPLQALKGTPKAAAILPIKDPRTALAPNRKPQTPTADDWKSAAAIKSTFKKSGALGSSFGVKNFDFEEPWVAGFPLAKYPEEKESYYWLQLEFAGTPPQTVLGVVAAEVIVPQEGLSGGSKVRLSPPGKDAGAPSPGQRRAIGPRKPVAKQEELLDGESTAGENYKIARTKLLDPVAILWSEDGKHFLSLSRHGLLQRISFPEMKQTLALDLTAQCLGLVRTSLGLAALIDENVPNQAGSLPRLVLVDEKTFQIKNVFDLQAGTAIAGAPSLSVVYILSRNQLSVFDLKAGKPTGRLMRQLAAIAVTGDGKHLVTGDVQLTRYRIQGTDLYEEQSSQPLGEAQRVWLSSDGKYAALIIQKPGVNYPGGPTFEKGAYVFELANLQKIPLALETKRFHPSAIEYDPGTQRFIADGSFGLCTVFGKDQRPEFDVDVDGSYLYVRLSLHPDGKHLLAVPGHEALLVTLLK